MKFKKFKKEFKTVYSKGKSIVKTGVKTAYQNVENDIKESRNKPIFSENAFKDYKNIKIFNNK